MNICTAAYYLKQNYKIRKPNWKPNHYIFYDVYKLTYVYDFSYSRFINGELKEITYNTKSDAEFSIDDFLSDDWELVVV